MPQAASTSTPIIVLLGGPGSGKGTHGQALASALDYQHLSSGEHFRDHIRRGTPLGRRARESIASGQLVPDEMAIELVQAMLAGSCTISNLTFGPIQASIAAQLGLERTTVLALQSVGGAMGNMVAIHNIVAVCSVLGLGNAEGEILKKTVGPMLLYGAIAAVMSLLV